MKKISTFLWGTGCFVFLVSASAQAAPRRPEPEKRVEKYSVSRGEPVKVRSRKTRIPLVVYGDGSEKEASYIPSGYMGDGTSINIINVYDSAPLASGQQGRTCLKIKYSGKGPEGWAGVYWLAPANNWGRVKGAGFDLNRADRLTFWVRGKKGGEVINKIQVGGVTAGPYPDSDAASMGPIRLSTDWEQYSLDISEIDLQYIIGGFAFITRRVDNRKGATFFLDEIVYEGKSDADLEKMVSAEDYQKAKEAELTLVEKSPTSEMAKLSATSPIRRIIPFSSAFTAFEDESRKLLDDVIHLAGTHPKSKVIIEGHTDNLGPASTNMRLSRERAKAVADYLIGKGLKKSKIVIIGYGGTRPVSPNSNDTAEGRKKNRRVEIVLIQT